MLCDVFVQRTWWTLSSGVKDVCGWQVWSHPEGHRSIWWKSQTLELFASCSSSHNSVILAVIPKFQSLFAGLDDIFLNLYDKIQHHTSLQKSLLSVLVSVSPSTSNQSEEPHSNISHKLTTCPGQVSSYPGVSFPNQEGKVVSLSDFWALPRCTSSSRALATLTRKDDAVETHS